MNITQHFVTNQNIPEYIKTNHEMFDTFIQAYYEWLENNNDSENSNYSDVYKAVGNPGWIVNNGDKVVDIDATIDEFVEYFAKEVCPIAIDEIQTNPKFFLKKIRDIYLAKGTPNAFKLFFKLYYNDNIDVFETGDTILRTSDGKYFAFPTAHFYVSEFQSNLDKIDFTLAELLDDSEKYVATILSGEVVGETKLKEAIVKVQFADEVTLDEGTYFIKSSDTLYQIKVSSMVSLFELSLTKTAPLYNTNDPIYVDSLSLGRRFYGSVESVSNGTVEGIKIRDRGVYYTPNDYFQFEDENTIDGNFTITTTGTYGDVETINNTPLRTGSQNTGFNAGNLEDVYVQISRGGTFRNLPKTIYNNVGDFTEVDTGKPYLKESTFGVGLQVTPTSSSIGTVRTVSMNQQTFFKDSDDVFINAPATVIVENNTLKKGDKVSFQKFDNLAKYEPLTDDSEEITFEYTIIHPYETGLPDGYVYLDSEKPITQNINFIYGFDSETFEWKHKSVRIKTEFDAAGKYVIQPLKDILDSESNMSYTIEEVYGPTDVLDGGQLEGTYAGAGDSEYDGGDSYDFSSSRKIDGGPEYSFAGSRLSKITIKFDGKSVRRLEEYHFNKINDIIGTDSELMLFEWTKTKGNPRLPTNDSDVGVWVDMGYIGEVVNISGNGQVAKVIGYEGSELPTQEILDNVSLEKYTVIKLSPLRNGVSVKDYSLPLTNVVHQVQRIDLSYRTAVVSSGFSKFYSQDGFISSDFGGTIQDNFYYSDYSYRIKSKLPLQDWKEKVKTMLHPAGFIMTSDFVQNSEVSTGVGEAQVKSSGNFKTALTFDKQQEFVDLSIVSQGITADNIYYKSNAFEALNINSNKADALLASNENTIRNLLFKQQSGNAFWDFEPVGHIRNVIDSETMEINKEVFNQYLNLDSEQFRNRYTTQHRDNLGDVDNRYDYYQIFDNSRQDLYKNQARTAKRYNKNLMISKTQFENAGLSSYAAYDSELPQGFAINFADSDSAFLGIEYRKLLSDNDNRYYPVYTIPRTKEIMTMKEKDFITAMREDGSLQFDDSDKVYVDMEAYERKWNEINNRRTRNNEGWTVKGYTQFVGYEMVEQRSKKRSKDWQTSEDRKNYTKKISPLLPDALIPDTLNWLRHYYEDGLINKLHVDYDYENESYRDPAVSMRKRRGR